MEKERKVLNHGFVRLVNHMGSDAHIVQAARVSYGKGTKSVSKDRGLIRYLMRNYHTTPFEMVSLQFHVKAPIFVFRQWHRHRTASINEISARYSELPDECYLPEESHVNVQSKNNKQGRGDLIYEEDAAQIISSMKDDQKILFKNYDHFLNQGVARELARINLPVSTYSEMYWKMDLHNLFHFLRLRMDSHAQYEIRQYADAVFELTKEIVPVACEAFEDYRLNSKGFSAQEMEVLRSLICDQDVHGAAAESKLSKREVNEFVNKLKVRNGC